MYRGLWTALPWATLAVLTSCSDSTDTAGDASATTTVATSTHAPSTTAAQAALDGESVRLGDRDAIRINVKFPDWLAADDSHLDVKLDGGSVGRIDLHSGAVIDSEEIAGERGVSGSGCQGIGIGFDSAWTCFGTDVVRIGLDPFTETSRIEAHKTATQGQLATGFGGVWVLQSDGSTLAHIDPDTESVSEPIALPVRGTDLTLGDDAIWVISAIDDAVLVLDPTTGTVKHNIDTISAPAAISIAGNRVWIGSAEGVHLIDRSNATILSTVAGGIGSQGDVAADDTGVWVRRDHEVRHIDAATGAETEAFALPLAGSSPGDMLVAGGALWISASEDPTLFRIALD